jgi:alanyl-tRNA synthetase
LRHNLGEHALQSGSVVEPDRLRFDFSHFAAVTPEELTAVENEVNEKILEDISAKVVETNLDEARKMGAMALFGEKYGNRVRVVMIGDYSTELCGGTHLVRTASVGSFKITSESSVGAGIRRIEAVTGMGVLSYIRDLNERLRSVASNLGSPVAEVDQASARLVSQFKDMQKQLEQIQAKGTASQAGELAQSAQEFNGIKVVASQVNSNDINILSSLADGITDRLRSGIIILGGVGDGKITFVCKVTPDLTGKGFHAGNLIREVAKTAGGGGGGKPEFAQAGGRDASKLAEALAKGVELVRQQAEG